ncbi:ATP-dependent zinc protease family protein [Allohahella marinimesophila]|uniref:ATP-dependent zinc protease n=1 Tax=Allohahella marinimesophila TaxID=1054972 RepID=A0ABP7NV59_9GAMM
MTVLPRNSRILFVGLALFFSVFASSFSHADNDPGKVIAGWIERVALPDIDGVFKAKLDSGAKTSSIYADEIEVFEKDGDKWVRFELVLKDGDGKERRIRMERERSRRVKIKNHDGVHDSRVTVDIDICFDGRKRTTEFTLADRREYLYAILLGRRFLEDVAVVDSDETYLTRASCKTDE